MNPPSRRPLQRSRSDRMVAGVCGGIAAAVNLDPTIVRLLAVLIILSSMGTGLMLYFILALVMPLSADGSGSLTATEVDGTSTELTFPGPSAAPIGAEPPAFTPDEVQRWDLPGARNLNESGERTLTEGDRT